jgi:thiamine-monophosphate kinase
VWSAFNVYADRLPIDDSTRQLAAFVGVDAVQIAMSASVDFELMFTMSPTAVSRCTDSLTRAGLMYHVIGEVNDVGRHALTTSR